MSRYFDAFDKKVRHLTKQHKDDDNAFLVALASQEADMKADCQAFIDDAETPADLKATLTSIILQWEVKTGAQQNDTEGALHALMSRSSRLSAYLHGCWHDIAKRRLQPRYGLVLDNPGDVAKRIKSYKPPKGS